MPLALNALFALAISGVLGYATGLVYLLERPLLAFYWALPGRPTPVASVAVVRIDDWPWPRRKTAALIESTAASGPKAIGITMLFVEKSNEVDDRLLNQAIARVGNVALGYVVSPVLIYPFNRSEADSVLFDIGFLDLERDDWGRIVGVIPTKTVDSIQHKAFAMVLAGKFDPAAAHRAEKLRGVVRPNFYISKDQLVHVSANDILRAPANSLRGKIAIIDVRLSRVQDIDTPIGAMTHGEYQAITLQNIVEGRWLRFNSIVNALILIVGGFLFGQAWGGRRRTLAVLLVVTYFGLSYSLMLWGGIVTSTASFALSLALNSFVMTRRGRTG